jgi:tRNA pseudouridine55 synthase
MDDIILIDKPAGWTSFDVVAKIRGAIRAGYMAKGEKPTKKQLRVGHAGTLDPFATGLLVILIGDACKKADQFLKLDKTYEFTAKLGQVSTTGDPEGEITVYSDDMPSENAVLTALEQFSGEITQIPPVYSAIKIDGKRAYKLAREGKSVEMPSRQVRINTLELISYEYPYVKCVCDVSSGTYIRTLVEDIGTQLGTGAYCTELRRTRISSFTIDESQSIEGYINSI